MDTSSCNRGLSDSARFGSEVTTPSPGLPADGVFILGRFSCGAAADRSNGDETSVLFAFFNKPWSSASFAVRTIARSVCVVDMSISGGNMGVLANGFSIEEKSGGFFVVVSSLLVGLGRVGSRLGNVLVLKRGSKGGGKPFLAALK